MLPSQSIPLQPAIGVCIGNLTLQVLEKQLGKEAAKEGESIDWLTFKNLEESVKGDVQLLKESKLIPDTIHISGHIYDVTDGSIKPVI